ncbi:MAG: LacI family DNA-binding transcriptional regulator [Vallitaleaceae bacterium]|nr:LacI family DNA-binding transcriptional regulator [Vallitaleaceae bacterium]
MITIKDVAKRAGVSIATVSYALNDKEGVNETNKAKIKQIAEEMGYVPNSLAQGLLSKRTNVIGVVIPDISNNYTSNFIKYLGIYARASGYFLLLGTLSDSPETEIDIFDKLTAKNVDGFVILPGVYDEQVYMEITRKLNRRNIPFLFAGLNFPGIKSNYVVPDLEEGEYEITRYLLKEGFRDLVFVGGNRGEYYSEVRYKGLLRAYEEFGLVHDESRYIELKNGYDFNSGYQVIETFLKQSPLPEVFACLNDSVAYGVIKGLKKQGLIVPKDVSVVGFDDIEMPTFDAAPLTTVSISVEEMAKLCIDILKNDEGKKVLKQILLPTELILRDSVQHK